MVVLRRRVGALAMLAALGACAEAAEPNIPTWNPHDKVQASEGWKVRAGIAVSPGEDYPTAHHWQAVAAGTHAINFDTPPASINPVTPTCKAARAEPGSKRYLVVGQGASDYPLIKGGKSRVPVPYSFSEADVDMAVDRHMAHDHSQSVLRFAGVGPDGHARKDVTMLVRDVVVTDLAPSLHLVLASTSGGLWNLELAPGVTVDGVTVYSGDDTVGVAGLSPDTPIRFVTAEHTQTQRCFTRIQARPDESWSLNQEARHAALKPVWRKFFGQVKREVGSIRPENVLSVDYAGHFLLGPAPTTYEGRVPYQGLAGKHIHVAANDHLGMTTLEQSMDVQRAAFEARLAERSGGGSGQ